MSKRLAVCLSAISIWVCADSAWARVSDFSDLHYGMSFGGGLYFTWLSGQNANDPVASMAPTGVTVTGQDSGRLLPVRLGAFLTTEHLDIEIYGRYMAVTGRSFTFTGGASGVGGVSYASLGGGLTLGYSLFTSGIFRLPFVVNAEYVPQKVTITAPGESVKLSAPSILVGGGLYPQIYLGSGWVLGILTAYQYGFNNHWTVSTGGTLMGRGFATGSALTDSAGRMATSQYGGFLFEAVLHLDIR